MLAEQILSPRPGHEPFLTNKACEEWDSKGNCTKDVVKDYDLADPMLRKALNDLTFSCWVGPTIYKICIDKVGLCHHFYEKCGFLGLSTCKREIFIPMTEYRFLLDAGTRCANVDKYGWDF